MGTANQKVLGDESIYPDEKVLKNLLGDSYQVFCDLIKLYDENGMTHEWRYYHDGNLWLLKVQKKSKTIVWMSAQIGHMNGTLYFPEKYIDEVFKLELSEEWKEKFRAAAKVGKSLPCTFEIREPAVLVDFEKVMQLKMKLK